MEGAPLNTQLPEAISSDEGEDQKFSEAMEVTEDGAQVVTTPRGAREKEGEHHTGMTPEPKRTRGNGEGNGEEQNAESQSTPNSQNPPPPRSAPQAFPHPPGQPQGYIPGQSSSSRQDTGSGIPAPEPMTLSDIFNHLQTGFQNVGGQVNKLREDLTRDLSKLRGEQEETKEMAAKALTTTTETQQDLKDLAKRVTALEMGPPPGLGKGKGAQGTGGKGNFRTTPTGYETLGGELGNEVIVGKITKWASKEDREQIWKKIQAKLPQELSEAVESMTAPGLRQRFILLHLKCHPQGTGKTREDMLNFCRQIKQANLQYEDEDGAMQDIFATPSKPYEQRQKDAAATVKADALKKLLGEPRSLQLEFEIGKGRAFLGTDLLTERKTFGGGNHIHLSSNSQALARCDTSRLRKGRGSGARRARQEKPA